MQISVNVVTEMNLSDHIYNTIARINLGTRRIAGDGLYRGVNLM